MSIYEAYFKFQGLVKDPIKDATNPHFKSKYVDLPGLMAVVKPALQECGLMIMQDFCYQENAHGLRTTIYDKKGDSINSFVPINPDKSNMQGFGSAVTYLRRYSIETICGICGTIDDDGNSASGSVNPALGRVMSKINQAKKTDPDGLRDFMLDKNLDSPASVKDLSASGLSGLEKDLIKFLG